MANQAEILAKKRKYQQEYTRTVFPSESIARAAYERQRSHKRSRIAVDWDVFKGLFLTPTLTLQEIASKIAKDREVPLSRRRISQMYYRYLSGLGSPFLKLKQREAARERRQSNQLWQKRLSELGRCRPFIVEARKHGFTIEPVVRNRKLISWDVLIEGQLCRLHNRTSFSNNRTQIRFDSRSKKLKFHIIHFILDGVDTFLVLPDFLVLRQNSIVLNLRRIKSSRLREYLNAWHLIQRRAWFDRPA